MKSRFKCYIKNEESINQFESGRDKPVSLHKRFEIIIHFATLIITSDSLFKRDDFLRQAIEKHVWEI